MRLALGMVVMVISALAIAQEEKPGGEFTPYKEIALHAEPEMAHLNNRVLYFVHFTCPYCRNAHGAIRDWGEGVPGSHDFEVIPAIGNEEHIVQGIGYYAALLVAPEKIRAYEAACYRILQDALMPPGDPKTYAFAASEAGIDRDAFLKAANSSEVTRYVNRAVMLTAAYGLQEVPVVVIANRFIAKPASVRNQNDAFITVLNGLFSMIYQDIQATR